ncbi:MAG: exodeoxyribonuclease VII large subunit, partial [Erysipelotrichia bacterium]|nr:exodeoxyribonuclease VII large subunit [Erysipelotrichia bacterium]
MMDVDITVTVSKLNDYIKKLIENDEALRYVYVHGEISNWKIASNGHAYFSLKDDNSMIGAVLFADYLKKLSFTPKDGDEVKALCSVTLYAPRGTYSLR